MLKYSWYNYYLAGAAVIFAQFDIDQIRSVAWFNTVGGVALIALQVALFRGESSFVKSGKRCWQFNQVLPKMKISCLDVFISFYYAVHIKLVCDFQIFLNLNPLHSCVYDMLCCHSWFQVWSV